MEPFAGSGQIPLLLAEAGYVRQWQLFDVDTSLSNVTHQDTLVDFPLNYRVTVSNPPYLSYHFARRKGLDVPKELFKGHPSLYLTAIELALAACEWVGFIIPESYLTTGAMTERLQHVISLPVAMFEDTEMPTCLALWGPEASGSFKVWRCSEYVGSSVSLFEQLTATPCAKRITFNKLEGQVSLKAIDDTKSASISFGAADLCPDSKVKASGRLISRIHVADLVDSDRVIRESNKALNEWRARTADFSLTAFKGAREDGVFRRRLDFANARAILSNAICKVENCSHDEVVSP